MQFIRKTSDTITSIGETVRIEVGPVRRREVATKEILSDKVTAAHYQVGKPDALGTLIVLGEPFDFIDWQSKERAWYVYQIDKNGTWQKVGVGHPAEDAALSAAIAIAT